MSFRTLPGWIHLLLAASVLTAACALDLSPNAIHPEVMRALKLGKDYEHPLEHTPYRHIHPSCADACDATGISRAARGCRNHRYLDACDTLCSGDGLRLQERCIDCLGDAGALEGTAVGEPGAALEMVKKRAMHVYVGVCEKTGYALPDGYAPSAKVDYELEPGIYGPFLGTRDDRLNVLDPKTIIGGTLTLAAIAITIMWRSM